MLNRPSPRLEILRAQLAREKFERDTARELYAYSAANPRSAHHYHPDYNTDLADMWPEKPASNTPQPAAPGVKEFDKYDESRYTALSARLADAGGAASAAALAGVKADTGMRHLVCVHGGSPAGYVYTCESADAAIRMLTMHGSDWRLCDADGWIQHTPAADSTCPVPNGVRYQYRLANGGVGEYRGKPPFWSTFPAPRARIVAWRPVAGGAA